jgi:hypothetical protein
MVYLLVYIESFTIVISLVMIVLPKFVLFKDGHSSYKLAKSFQVATCTIKFDQKFSTTAARNCTIPSSL